MNTPYLDDRLEPSYWDDDPNKLITSSGNYIAVSGNTGAGKSTLVKAIRDQLRQVNHKTIGINERVLHHPLLKLMFHFPKDYSFFIQLNFALQRSIILHRWLSLGYTVVIERSHFDDRLFVEHHYQKGHISLKEYETYMALSDTLNEKLPEPDIYVFLSAAPSLSMARLRRSEDSGERPKEFPDEEVKYTFVEAWHRAYENHFNRLKQEQDEGLRFKNTKFLKWNAETATEDLVSETLKFL